MYETTYTYPDGINFSDFAEIYKMLLKGTSIEFNCGASQYGSRDSAENNVEFQKHVKLWVGYIQDYFVENHNDIELHFDYCSKENWKKVHVHSPMSFKTNLGAKRFLSKEY